MKISAFFILIFLNEFVSFGVKAETVFSCEASNIAGNNQTLEPKIYAKTYPTIILNRENKSLLFVYSKNEAQWKKEYTIIIDAEPYIVSFHKLEGDWVALLHFDLDKKEFTSFFSGETGNTFSFGKCY